MFLSIHTRVKIQDIFRRISINQEITFQERILFENHPKKSSSIFVWLTRTIGLKSHCEQNQQRINEIIQSLALDGLDYENHFDSKNENTDT